MASKDDQASKQETCPIPVSIAEESCGQPIDGNASISSQEENIKSSADLDSNLNTISEKCPENALNVLDGKADNIDAPETENGVPQSNETVENRVDSKECVIQQDVNEVVEQKLPETAIESQVLDKENCVEALTENQHLSEEDVNQHKVEMRAENASFIEENIQAEENIQSSHVSKSMEESSTAVIETGKKPSDSKTEQGTSPVKGDDSLENNLCESKFENSATPVEGVSGSIGETQLADSSPVKDPAKENLLNEENVEGVISDVEIKQQCTEGEVDTDHPVTPETNEGPVDKTSNVGVATEHLDNSTEGKKHMENAENIQESGMFATEILHNPTEGSNLKHMGNAESVKDAAAILPESGDLGESTPVDSRSYVEEPLKESESLTETDKKEENTTADLEIRSENSEKETEESKDLIGTDNSRDNAAADLEIPSENVEKETEENSQVSSTIKDVPDIIEQQDIELKASQHVDANSDGCGMVLPQTVHTEDINQESQTDPCCSKEIVIDKQISEGHETAGDNEMSDACMDDTADGDMGYPEDDIVGGDSDDMNEEKVEMPRDEDKPVSKREKVWKVKYQFSVGDLVWAKVRSHPWWPAQIFDPEDASESARKVQRPGKVLVAFYGDYTFAWVKHTQMLPFRPHFKKKVKQTKIKSFTKAVNEALQEFCRRSELAFTCIHCSDPLHSSNNVLDKSGGVLKGVIVQKHKDITESKHLFIPKKTVDYVKAVASSPFDSWNSTLEMSELRGHAYGLRNFMVSLHESEFNFLYQRKADESSQKKRGRRKNQAKDTNEAYDGMPKSKKKRGAETEKVVKESGRKRSRKSKQQEAPTDGGETLLDFFRTKVMNRVKSKENDDPTKPREKSIWEVSLEVFSTDAEVRSKKASDKQSPENERDKKRQSTKKLSALDDFDKDTELRTKRTMDKPTASPVKGKRKRQSSSYLGKSSKRKSVAEVAPERKDSKITHTVSKVGDSIRKVAGKLTGLFSAAKCSSDPAAKRSVSVLPKSKKDSSSSQKRKFADVPKKGGRRKSKRRSKRFNASPSSEESSEPEKETVQYSRRTASAEEKTSSERPLGLFMKFPEDFELPSEFMLEEVFSSFGPLQSPGTKVDTEASTAQVVFKHGSDAETAWNHARKNQLFGEGDVTYRLRYLSPASRTDADSNKSNVRQENGTYHKDGTTDEEAAANDDKSEVNGDIQTEMMTLLKQVSHIVGTTPETGASEKTSA